MWNCSDEVNSDGNYLSNSCKCYGTATFTQNLVLLPELVFTVKVVQLGAGFKLGFTGRSLQDMLSVDSRGCIADSQPICTKDMLVTVHIKDKKLMIYMDEIPAISSTIDTEFPVYLILTLYAGSALLFDMSLSLSHFTQNVSVIRKQSVSVIGINRTTFNLDAISNKMNQDGSLGSVIFNRPLSAKYHFFQLKIVECGGDSAIAIGLADRSHNPSKFPGWMKRSCGYHSDDGVLFKKGQHAKEMPTCDKNDVMGCGIKFFERNPADVPRGNGEAEKGEKVLVYFTKNGAKVGEVVLSVPEHGFYPTIGLSSGDRAFVDFAAVSG